MIVLWAGLFIFLGMHAIPMHVSARAGLVEKLGEGPYKGLFSLISALGLGLIIWGYSLAAQNPIVVYYPPEWMRHITLLLMVPVFILFLATYLPGKIKATVKHPTLAAVKLWALAHLLANGTLADVLLFLSFLVWAVAAMISAKRRANPQIEASKAGFGLNDVLAIGLGLGFYGIFAFWLHEYLIGIPPIA